MSTNIGDIMQIISPSHSYDYFILEVEFANKENYLSESIQYISVIDFN